MNLAAHINDGCQRLSVKQPSIYRVPEHLRRLNEDAYTPCHISIGPFHHRDDKYRVMEERKLVYTRDLIRRARVDNNISDIVDEAEVTTYINLVRNVLEEAHRSYAETLELTHQFVIMMLIDGCFIVEFLCRKIRKLSLLERQQNPIKGEEPLFTQVYDFVDQKYDEWTPSNDFIFQSTRTSFEVRRDLILLENQLPYVILKRLFEHTFPNLEKRPEFYKIVYCALRTSIPNTTQVLTRDELEIRFNDQERIAHLVTFLQMCCVSLADNGNGNVNANGNGNVIDINPMEFPCLCNMEAHDIRVPSATKLAKAGVVFKKAPTSNTSSLNIWFEPETGILWMSSIIMWQHTETFFRNVMAHELYNHTTNTRGKSVSDYMCFMDDLINTKEDVELLVKSEIIQNWLESDEVVADVFNSITRHILADYSSYSETCNQLNSYRQQYHLRRLKGILKQDYFNKPWAITYFFIFVIVQTTLSIIQTWASVKSTDTSK